MEGATDMWMQTLPGSSSGVTTRSDCTLAVTRGRSLHCGRMLVTSR